MPYDIRNYAVMRVFGKMSWGYYAGLRFPKTGHPVNVSLSELYFLILRPIIGNASLLGRTA